MMHLHFAAAAKAVTTYAQQRFAAMCSTLMARLHRAAQQRAASGATSFHPRMHNHGRMQRREAVAPPATALRAMQPLAQSVLTYLKQNASVVRVHLRRPQAAQVVRPRPASQRSTLASVVCHGKTAAAPGLDRQALALTC
jgi:hypothetical protein